MPTTALPPAPVAELDGAPSATPPIPVAEAIATWFLGQTAPLALLPTHPTAGRASAAPPREPFAASFTYPFDLGYAETLADWHEDADDKLIQALKPRQRWHPLFDAGAKLTLRDDDEDAPAEEPADEQIARLIGSKTRTRAKPRPRLATASERAASPRPAPAAHTDMETAGQESAPSADEATASLPAAAATPATATAAPAGARPAAAPSLPPAPKPSPAATPRTPAKVLARIADQRRTPPPAPPAPTPTPARSAAKRPAATPATPATGKRATATNGAGDTPHTRASIPHVAGAPDDGGSWAGRLAHGLREYAAALDMLGGLEEELRATRRHLAEADLRIGLLEEDNARLRKDLHDFRHWVMVHAGLATPVAKDAPPPTSLLEAVMRVEQEHDEEYIVFHPRAFDSAEDAPYGGSLEEAYRALSDIATIARSYHEGVIGKDPKSAFAEKGWEYRPDVSDGAAGHNRSAYHLPWPPGVGEMRRLGPHIGVGGRGNAADTLRIYWFRDSAKRRFVIGHIGRHLPDSTT